MQFQDLFFIGILIFLMFFLIILNKHMKNSVFKNMTYEERKAVEQELEKFKKTKSQNLETKQRYSWRRL